MAIFNCVSCGGAFDAGNLTYVQCPHCGTSQSVPQQVQQQVPQQVPQSVVQEEKKSKKKTIIIIIAAVLAALIIPICILAAMFVPSLLAYKDNSDQKSFMQACDSIKTSVLTEYTNEYAESGKKATQYTIDWNAVSDLCGVDVSNSSSSEYVVSFTMDNNTLTSMIIISDDFTGRYDSGTWTVTEN